MAGTRPALLQKALVARPIPRSSWPLCLAPVLQTTSALPDSGPAILVAQWPHLEHGLLGHTDEDWDDGLTLQTQIILGGGQGHLSGALAGCRLYQPCSPAYTPVPSHPCLLCRTRRSHPHSGLHLSVPGVTHGSCVSPNFLQAIPQSPALQSLLQTLAPERGAISASGRWLCGPDNCSLGPEKTQDGSRLQKIPQSCPNLQTLGDSELCGILQASSSGSLRELGGGMGQGTLTGV